MFLVCVAILWVLVLFNLLITHAHLTSIVKVSSNLRNNMHEFFETKNMLFKKFQNRKHKINVTSSNFEGDHTSNLESPASTSLSKISSSRARKVKINSVIVRPDACQSCFAHNFNYIIDNPNICATGGNSSSKIDIIILIFTEHKRKVNRDTVRETWMSPYKQNTGNIRYAFLLGYTNNTEAQKAIEKENQIHRDIIQEDFIDAYKNLTYKTIMAFKWAHTKCGHARFLMKTDDDMYVNTAALLKAATANEKQLQKSMGGACRKSLRPIRARNSKWYASFTSYPRKSYPGFCSGTGYVTSMTMAEKVLQISKHVPFFHLEDVYVALCVRKLGLTLFPIRGFNSVQVRPHTCHYKSDKVITSHYMPPQLTRKIWALKC